MMETGLDIMSKQPGTASAASAVSQLSSSPIFRKNYYIYNPSNSMMDSNNSKAVATSISP